MDGTDSARGQRGQLGRAHLHPGKISEQKGRRGENVNQTDTARTRGWETKAHRRDKGQVGGVFVKGSTWDILFLNVHLLGSRAALRKKQGVKECGGRKVEDLTDPKSLIPFVPIQKPVPGRGSKRKESASNASRWRSGKNQKMEPHSRACDSFIGRC